MDPKERERAEGFFKLLAVRHEMWSLFRTPQLFSIFCCVDD